MSETAREEAEEAASAWLANYHGSIDTTALILAFNAGYRAALSVPETENWEYGVGWESRLGDGEYFGWKAKGGESEAREHVAKYPVDDDGRPYYVVRRTPETSAGHWEPVPVEEDNR